MAQDPQEVPLPEEAKRAISNKANYRERSEKIASTESFQTLFDDSSLSNAFKPLEFARTNLDINQNAINYLKKKIVFSTSDINQAQPIKSPYELLQQLNKNTAQVDTPCTQAFEEFEIKFRNMQENLKISDSRVDILDLYIEKKAEALRIAELATDPTKRIEQKRAASGFIKQISPLEEKISNWANDKIKTESPNTTSAIELYSLIAAASENLSPIGILRPKIAQQHIQSAIEYIQNSPGLMSDPLVKQEFIPALSIINSQLIAHLDKYVPEKATKLPTPSSFKPLPTPSGISEPCSIVID